MPSVEKPPSRILFLSVVSVVVGLAMACVAQALLRLISFFTQLAFYGRFSFGYVSPAGHHLGWWVILVPISGAVLVGFIARYGSPAIRGHGIPEAMEQVLLNQSIIPMRVFLLKPLSAALSIGTGGPFGAEGPIIATGGSFGSLIGQWFKTSPLERKILLAAGAAAGMAATFGCPISAILLAVELLLFEFHPRSFVPVALASASAAGLRQMWVDGVAVFPMPQVAAPAPSALFAYVALGAIVGLAAVLATRAVYAMEDLFDELPLHWMWWPALGAVAVGVLGFIEPRTLGVGYENISGLLSGEMTLASAGWLSLLKSASWTISLASGTSGGTLAPLLTIGAGAGTILAKIALSILPSCGLDTRMAALVGMAAIFAGASGALLASVVFAIETTYQSNAIIAVLGGCTASYLVARQFMRTTIMTEKIARRGVLVPAGYTADLLDRTRVIDVASKPAVCLKASDPIEKIAAWLASGEKPSRHKGFPVLDARGKLTGFVSRRDLLNSAHKPGRRLVADLVSRPPVSVREDATLRQAVHLMLRRNIGLMPVVSGDDAGKVVGVLAKRDLVSVYHQDEEFSPGSGDAVSPRSTETVSGGAS